MKRIKSKNIGESNGRCKSDESVILAIRRKHKEGYNREYLARHYGYSVKGIEAIIYRRVWRHI